MCASVGIMLVLQAVAVLNLGTQAVSTRPLLPSGSFDLAGTIVPGDRLWFAGIVAALTAVLALVYRYTRFGLATRAAAEISSFIAGLGRRAARLPVSPETFAVFNSLGLLAIAYVAGIGRIAGVAIAGVMLSSTGLMVSGIDKWVGVGKYQTLVTGIALAFTAIQNPDGVWGRREERAQTPDRRPIQALQTPRAF